MGLKYEDVKDNCEYCKFSGFDISYHPCSKCAAALNEGESFFILNRCNYELVNDLIRQAWGDVEI